ncbi:MAG: LPS export ABC transporter periplasmic protein LptC [Candidatus Cloacimonas sp.]
MKKRLYPIWIASVSIIILLSACQKVDLQSQTGILPRDLPDETSYQVKLTQMDNDRNEYILEADKIERFYDRRLLYAYKVTLTTFDKNNNISSVIKADTTIVDEARNYIFASGNAKLTSPNGTLATQKMAWDRTVDEISAPLEVTVTRSGNVMLGKNLRTNSKLSYVEMDAVSAEGYFKKEEIKW